MLRALKSCSSSARIHTLPLSDAQRKTIYALSTPPGKSGVAVIRVSGPEALHVWHRTTRAATQHKETQSQPRSQSALHPEPWKLERRHVVDPHTSELLDDALAVYFRGEPHLHPLPTDDAGARARSPLSYNLHTQPRAHSLPRMFWSCTCTAGEPSSAQSSLLSRASLGVALLHRESSRAVRTMVVGSTSHRSKACAISWMPIRSPSGVRRCASQGWGETRVKFQALREEIIACLALVEALIDFGEGEDIEEGVFEEARQRAQRLKDKIQSILSDNRRGEIMRAGIRLAIFGPPNVGKSSLLNFLAQREAAIVTHVPGTTRDVLELSLDIGGLPVLVADTAGLRETADEVECIGIERAQKAVQAADASLLVLAFPDAISVTPSGPRLEIPSELVPLVTPNTFVLLNKTDLLLPTSSESSAALAAAVPQYGSHGRCWAVSLASQAGTGEFLAALATALQDRYGILQDSSGDADAPLIAHARHRAHLESALGFLDAFLVMRDPDEIVLGAEELRYAAQAVGKISGLVDVEDVLDVIFSQFCIGK